MLTEALILAATGIAFVFLFLGLLVFAVKGMSAISSLIYKSEQIHASHEPMQAQRQAALVAACTHHHVVNRSTEQ